MNKKKVIPTQSFLIWNLLSSVLIAAFSAISTKITKNDVINHELVQQQQNGSFLVDTDEIVSYQTNNTN